MSTKSSSSPNNAKAPKTFQEAYGVLQANAEALRSQREPDLDGLLTLVQQSMVAYEVCKEKIESVEKALAATLAEAEDDASEPSE